MKGFLWFILNKLNIGIEKWKGSLGSGIEIFFPKSLVPRTQFDIHENLMSACLGKNSKFSNLPLRR